VVDPLLAVAIFAELAEERPRGGADDAHELSERLAGLEENAP
jgi:hypothetical protein